ncbi:cytochrome P450 [Jatrophihabitans sp.]|uniref:cytochrome P450 n=1 Tax=Jatrophihabitans sp. TaxID=1932789 RepID=UPI0030C6B272|nr:hypothetical protein [Jatrophihabitans sp.]
MTTRDAPRSDFDHHSSTFAARAFEISDTLLAECPVSWSEHYGGFWVVADYDHVTEAFRDHESFSSAKGASVPDLSFGSTHLPTTLDPPEHHVFRKYLNPWFTLEAMRKREPQMRELIRELIEGLAAKGTWDFVPDLADIMPGTMILVMLGMSTDRRDEFLGAMERGMSNQGTTDPGVLAQMAEDKRWLQEQLLGEIADRRKNPSDDLMSYLANEPLSDGRQISDSQIIDIVMVLLLAGFHTTSGALAALLVHLEQHPDQRRHLQQNPDMLPTAIEEIVRVYSPATAMARTLTKDMEYGGVQMAKGDRALMVIMAANRDPEHFTDPAEVDLQRSERGSVAFGWGVHRCLGIHLARVLLRLQMELLFEIIPDYHVDLAAVRLSTTLGIGYVHTSVPGHAHAVV